MTTYGDTLNQTFPGVSSTGDGELHRTFHTPSQTRKSTGFNFEQQFLFGQSFKIDEIQMSTILFSFPSIRQCNSID